MAINVESMHQYWMESSIYVVDGKVVVPPDWACCEGLMLIRETMVELAKSKEPLFRKPQRVRKGRPGAVATKAGRNLQLCLGVNLWEIYTCFPQHRFDPYFNLFADIYLASPLWHDEFLRRDVDQLNEFVANLRAAAKRTGFTDSVANHERGTVKNTKVVKQYLNALYDDYPKILHVRVDFYYKIVWPRPDVSPVSAEQMKKDRAKLMRYVRKKFGDTAIGHMWTVEFGALKGPHFHIFFHFHGHKIRQGITIAQQLGEYWQHVITNGRGRYWNINKHEDAFEAQGRRGIGLISHADEKRRENLLRAALYLVKTDLFVRIVMPGIGKTFGHGILRPRRKGNAGRKRKGSPLHAWMDATSARRGLR